MVHPDAAVVGGHVRSLPVLPARHRMDHRWINGSFPRARQETVGLTDGMGGYPAPLERAAWQCPGNQGALGQQGAFGAPATA